MNNKVVWIVVLVLVGLCCCVALVVVAGAGLFAYNAGKTSTGEGLPAPTVEFNLLTPELTSFPSGLPTEATPGLTNIEPTAMPELKRDPVGDAAIETLKTLTEALVPVNDMGELAQRLGGKGEIPETVPAPTTPLKVGETRKFWVSNVDTNDNFQVDATLRYIGDNLYFWVQDGVKYDKNDLEKLASTFDQKIYPKDRGFFGSEWKPGIDNDPRLYIVYAGGLGKSLAGYFSSADSVPPQAHPYSNAHEMFLLNADNVNLAKEFTYSVLAHEFQHMIHWKADRNEESWMNEGFSELAAYLNGYNVGGFDFAFMADPDLQLNDWPNDQNLTSPHYGAGFLYLAYFLDRFGENATKMVVADPQNGLNSIDEVLGKLGTNNALTGKTFTADDVFADWAAANYLKDGNVGDGRYTYRNYSQAPQAEATENVTDCPSDWQSRTVHQYGTDYVRIVCKGKLTLSFEGATEVGVLPESAHSGSYAFWSNKGDESDMTLAHSFDFTGVSGPLTMSYWTWYDLEKDYDFSYLTASEDGKTWKIVKTPSCTTENKSGNSYGCGYNATSAGWVQETVDLAQYAGKKVQLRFEYVTDAAVNGEGMLLDDISIPAVNYSTDFEADNGGWESAGFVRIQNRLPQTFRLSLIKEGGDTTVQTIQLNSDQSASIPVDFGSGTKDVVLVVSGTTRFTRIEADYRFALK